MILYLHGGAYVVGSARAYRQFAGQIASRANAPAFVTDYGLVPERPFPAAVGDAEAAYRGLASGGFSRIAFVGDSAGGGLALVVAARMAQAARELAALRPVAACVMSPWSDLASTGEASGPERHTTQCSPRRASGRRQATLPGTGCQGPTGVAALRRSGGSPPVLLHVGED